MSDIEIALRLSLFREGFADAVAELATPRSQARRPVVKMNDRDYAAGYSAGASLMEQSLASYKSALTGR